MPEFKVGLFNSNGLERYLNAMRSGGYFVKIESIVKYNATDFLVVIFRYIPSKNQLIPGDVSQPETWKEPEIDLSES